MGDQEHTAASGESITDAVYAFLRGQIVSGELPPDTRLTEAWITNATGASRTPVREALRRLSAEGYVASTPNKGARVASLGLADADEIFALRQLLEPFAAGAAARGAGPDDVRRLRELAQAMNGLTRAKPENWGLTLAELNREFHSAILEISGYVRLRMMAESLVLSGLVSVTFVTYNDDELSRSMHHHDELVAAIEAGDEVWASSVMRAHLLAAESVAKRIVHSGTAVTGERAAMSTRDEQNAQGGTAT